jgi:hypothetical protein
MIKKLKENDLKLTYTAINKGCQVHIEAITPKKLFNEYEGDLEKLKNELQEICDDWVEELDKSVDIFFPIGKLSLTPENIFLIRQYSFIN